MNKKILEQYGYKTEQIEKILNNHSLKPYKKETLTTSIVQVFEFLKSLGYTKNEIIKMTYSYPALFSYSIENMEQKIKDIETLGYNKTEILKMTVLSPQLFGTSIENIKQKYYLLMKK